MLVVNKNMTVSPPQPSKMAKLRLPYTAQIKMRKIKHHDMDCNSCLNVKNVIKNR